jgi:CheY-like chemotaxis protein
MPNEKKIVALLSDLMFTVKIQEAAKRAGVDAMFVKSEDAAIAQARQNPAVLIIDLNDPGINALDVISKLKGDNETAGVKLLGFVSHVQADLKRAAEEMGCDTVLPRSAFSSKLPEILRRYVDG